MLPQDAVEQVWLYLLGPVLGAGVVWWLVGRRDRAALKKRFPEARGRWMCGWIGVIPYGITSLMGLAARCDMMCAELVRGVVNAAVSAPAGGASRRPYRELNLTAAAAVQLRDMATRSQREYIRVTVTDVASGQFQARLTATDEVDLRHDRLIHAHGVCLAVDPDSAGELSGMTLDYSESAGQHGFVFLPTDPELP